MKTLVKKFDSVKGKPELIAQISAEELKETFKKCEIMRSQLEGLKRENSQLNKEKSSITQDYNVEYKKKVYLLDFSKRLIEKIEKPIQRVLEDSLSKIDFREDYEKEYKFMVTFLEGQRVT